MIYKYRAKKGLEDIVEGTIDASTEKEAIEKVSQLGLLPIRLVEEASVEESMAEELSDGINEPQPSSLREVRGKVKARTITIFTRQLASLLRSGVPILNAINVIREQSENPRLESILHNIHDEIKEGATFSSALAKYPKVFSSLYIPMVRAGEDTGNLPEVLLKIADYRMKQEEMLSRIRMSLAYPILMAVVGVGTVVFMLTFVMPRLMGIFGNLGEALPLPTRIVLAISQGLRQKWYWIVLILATIVFIIKRLAKTNKLFFSIFKLRIPVFGNFILKAELSRFSRTLELLIRSGIPILKTITIAIPVLGNEVIKNQLRHSYEQLEQGGSFGRSLKNSKVFPAFMSNLITVGEESGRLDEALAEVAGSYERETDEAMRVMVSLLEPLMILGMGVVVGFIVVAMLLPIFEINMVAK